jgi:putative peptidoglycan lipid II flippase
VTDNNIDATVNGLADSQSMANGSSRVSSNTDDTNINNTSQIARGTGLVGSMTIISRILGFIRDMVCAKIFGASASYDAFLVAFKIPNFLRRLFAEGAFAQAFVPILSEYRATKSKQSVYKLLNHVSGMLGGILLIVATLGMLLAPVIIRIFAPGFETTGPRLDLAVNLLRITFPYIFFISLTAFLGSILNSFDKFAMPAFTPVLLNIAMIASALLLSSYFAEPVTALAWGVFVGGVLQFGFLIFFVWKINLLPKPSLSGDQTGVSRILKNMIPALFGVSVAQINLLFDTIFASFLPKGSISWLYYSDRLMEFPLGVFGVALATVVLPHLSRQHAQENQQDFEFTLDWTLQLIILIGLPAALGLFLLAEPLVITLFNYGKFTALDSYMAGMSLKAFACGLLAFVSIKILASANYARKDIRTPVRIAAVCMVINIILSLILMQFFYHVGLAMAGAITGFLNAGLLLIVLVKRKIYKPILDWKKFTARITVANLAWVFLLYQFNPRVDTWLSWGAFNRVVAIFTIISLVLIVYFSVLRLLGFNLRKQLVLSRV